MKKLIKIVKRIMFVFLSLITLIAIITYFYMRQPKFGKLPSGERLERIEKSPNYKGGKFTNLVEKPTISEGYSIIGELYKTLVKSIPNKTPSSPLPSVKTNLKTLPKDEDVMVWFGHSSFFLKVDDVNILADPVFSGSASPIPGSVKAYPGTDIYQVEDLPEIDYLLISHDHYDHLDYKTILQLKEKVNYVICGLGVGAHFEYWGFPKEKIIEKDWGGKVNVKSNFTIYTESTHHASGRGFRSDKSLWLSFLIQSPSLNIYYSGDGGRDERFKTIHKKNGAIDWAIMECGQYNKAWQSVHQLPEEVVKATNELQAKHLVTVHHSKFSLARHPWNEPLQKITELSQNQSYRLATPIIGEKVKLKDSTQVFKKWWETVK